MNAKKWNFTKRTSFWICYKKRQSSEKYESSDMLSITKHIWFHLHSDTTKNINNNKKKTHFNFGKTCRCIRRPTTSMESQSGSDVLVGKRDWASSLCVSWLVIWRDRVEDHRRHRKYKTLSLIFLGLLYIVFFAFFVAQNVLYFD